MEQIKTKIRKWGNSLGIVLPKEIVSKKNLKEGSEINVFVQEKPQIRVKDLFEISNKNKKVIRNKSTEELMKEIDREIWNIKK
mgnify:CR=1 FL=1